MENTQINPGDKVIFLAYEVFEDSDGRRCVSNRRKRFLGEVVKFADRGGVVVKFVDPRPGDRRKTVTIWPKRGGLRIV